MKIIVYGNGDKDEKTGFPTEESFIEYIKGGIFTKFNGRYRYSQQKSADIILLSRKGKAYGYFVIRDIQSPNENDLTMAKKPRKVYLVKESVSFQNSVLLKNIEIKGYQFGKQVSIEQFDKIKFISGIQTIYSPTSANM